VDVRIKRADLPAAFAGENYANRKYLAFAQQAEKEGFKQIAKLFWVAAAAETVHALGLFKAMSAIKDTKANLLSAAEGYQGNTNFLFNRLQPAQLFFAELDSKHTIAGKSENRCS